MAFRRTWKDAALASALALAWVPLGCSETPQSSAPASAATSEPAASKPEKSAGKGKKLSKEEMNMGIKELREQRAAARAKSP
ncbi:MAG: hypothetical protein BGO49_16375 [Planctomycetales bacterium 71-10]|nr:MAG: hypothetical protein BGO49_16375 [Planctomycetales bacterium 71-10]